MQTRTVTVSRYHASQLPQPLPQYYTMIGRGAADDEDADLHGEHSAFSDGTGILPVAAIYSASHLRIWRNLA